MADKTKIEWTDATWNPITGCSVVSPGCTNCYAMRLAGTRLKHIPSRVGLTRESKAGPVWNGTVLFNEPALLQPLKWKRPRMIFVCAHGDLFAENVPDAWIDQVFAVMALAPQHTFQVLTKRPERMRAYLSGDINRHRIMSLACDMAVEGALNVTLVAAPEFEATAPPGPPIRLWEWPLPNVWLGVSVEDQKRADERIPVLLDTPAAVRFISAEPILGDMDIIWAMSRLSIDIAAGMLKRGFFAPGLETIKGLDWVIAGGESGPGARPMHPDWARSLRAQCWVTGVPFFIKQWGEWLPEEDMDETAARETYQADLAAGRTWRFAGMPMRRVGKARAGRLLDGIEHNAMPSIDRRAA